MDFCKMSIQHLGTGSMNVPSGTTAQRPVNPGNGHVRYNTSLNSLEFYNTIAGAWQQLPYGFDGSSSIAAANNAVDIKTVTGTSTNGFYWIKNNSGTATQVWCDMQNNGGGWMMVARLHTNSNFWKYDDGIWTDGNLLNATQPYDYGDHIKHSFYTSKSFTQVRIAMNTLSNGIVESTWSNGSSFANFMTATTSSSNSRTTWVNWINNAIGSSPSWLVNCNQFGTNRAYNYQYAKLGATLNGENDCATNDESFGFGLKGIAPYTNVVASGAFSPYTGIGTPLRVGWIFIK
jgi:hypothetical protein